MNWIEFLRKDIQEDLNEKFEDGANEYTVMSYLRALDRGASLSNKDIAKIKKFVLACRTVLRDFNITHYKFYYESGCGGDPFLFIYCCGIEVDEDANFDRMEKDLQEFMEMNEIEENCGSFDMKVF